MCLNTNNKPKSEDSLLKKMAVTFYLQSKNNIHLGKKAQKQTGQDFLFSKCPGSLVPFPRSPPNQLAASVSRALSSRQMALSRGSCPTVPDCPGRCLGALAAVARSSLGTAAAACVPSVPSVPGLACGCPLHRQMFSLVFRRLLCGDPPWRDCLKSLGFDTLLTLKCLLYTAVST